MIAARDLRIRVRRQAVRCLCFEIAHVTKLFVYGTLKRGHCRDHFLKGQRFLGEARTAPKYRLFDLGSFPGMVLSLPGLSIVGELWEIDGALLPLLDAEESAADDLFGRKPVELLPPFDAEPAVAYLYGRNVAGFRECGDRW